MKTSIVIGLVLLTIVLVSCTNYLPDCTEVTNKECYRYYGSIGIFSGVESVEVSCTKEYDWRWDKYYGEGCWMHSKKVFPE